MTITRDVILDLMPLYESGDASADTKALVERYLAEHPDLRRQLTADPAARLRSEPAPPLSPTVETRTLARSRRHNRWYPWVLAVAIASTALPFSVADVGDVTWFMLRDNPVLAASLGATAVVFWTIAWSMKRRLRNGSVA